MVAPNTATLRCLVLEVAPAGRLEAPNHRYSARQLVPGADPYIAMLIERLSAEVRAERAAQRGRRAEGGE